MDLLRIHNRNRTSQNVPDINELKSSTPYFRGVSEAEAASWIKGKPVASNDLMPLDYEVVAYGIGDEIRNMSEKQIEKWVRGVVDWYDGTLRSIKGGLNVTTDFQNAEGYGEYVLGLDTQGEVAEFSDSHSFFRSAKDAILKFVYDVEKNKIIFHS